MSVAERSSKQPVSIRDVARVAGVSRQTVSRVINEHPSLRPETRDRVRAVIDELHYRPNRAARALGSNRSRTIGVLASVRAQYGPSAAIQGIESAAQEFGYLVHTINLLDSSSAAIRAALTLQIDSTFAGLVIIAPQTRTLTVLDELDLAIPYVLLHSRSAEDPHELSVDQSAGAQAATGHLLDLGHRRISHLAGPQDWIEAEARLQGFLAELARAEIAPTSVLIGDWTAESGYQAGRELARAGDLSAVFSSNDQMALGLIHAFREAGLDVPGDVSVVGYDDIPEAAHYWPPLTTVRQDFNDLGRRCVSRLLQPAAAAEEKGAALLPRLVVRCSTRAVG